LGRGAGFNRTASIGGVNMSLRNIEDTGNAIKDFVTARDWMQFHSPKNLAISISLEANELLELFQWMDCEASTKFATENKERVAEEIADVAIYLFELCDNLGIDLLGAMDDKLKVNATKYPVQKAKGNYKKYKDLQS
jgi:dCTP diphosphatase